MFTRFGIPFIAMILAYTLMEAISHMFNRMNRKTTSFGITGTPKELVNKLILRLESNKNRKYVAVPLDLSMLTNIRTSIDVMELLTSMYSGLEDIPEWCNWITIDNDGKISYWSHMPTLSDDESYYYQSSNERGKVQQGRYQHASIIKRSQYPL